MNAVYIVSCHRPHCVVEQRGSAPGCRMLLILAGIISHSPHDSTDAFASTPDGQHLWVNSRRNRCVTPLKFPVSKRRARALDPSPPRGVELTSPPPLPRSAHPLPLRRHRTDVATGCGLAVQISALAFHPFDSRSTLHRRAPQVTAAACPSRPVDSCRRQASRSSPSHRATHQRAVSSC